MEHTGAGSLPSIPKSATLPANFNPRTCDQRLDHMPTPQLLNDVISLLLLLAPSAALVSLVLAGVNLRHEGGTTFASRGPLHKVDVLGGRVSHAAAATDLVLFVRN